MTRTELMQKLRTMVDHHRRREKRTERRLGEIRERRSELKTEEKRLTAKMMMARETADICGEALEQLGSQPAAEDPGAGDGPVPGEEPGVDETEHPPGEEPQDQTGTEPDVETQRSMKAPWGVQMEVIRELASRSGGRISTGQAVKAVLAAGVTWADPKNLPSALHKMMSRSPLWRKTGRGTFELAGPAAEDEKRGKGECPEGAGEFGPTSSLMEARTQMELLVELARRRGGALTVAVGTEAIRSSGLSKDRNMSVHIQVGRALRESKLFRRVGPGEFVLTEPAGEPA